jgi:hypothetical protein
MSNSSFERSIIASIGFNDGANKGFWRIQPRDDEGQWIEMGAGVLFRFRTGKGNLVVATEKGVYVGPSGRPGMARVLVAGDTESGLKAGVYEVESRNLQQFKAIIPTKTGKGTGAGARTDKFGKPVKTLADSNLPSVENLLNNVQDITKEDQRLAKGELTPAEKEAEQDGRANSPVADLPAGFEAENPDQVKDLLRETGINPEEFDKKPGSGAEISDMTDKDSEYKELFEADREDSITNEVMDRAFHGDNLPNLDSIINALETPPQEVSLRDLKPGDVISLGKQGQKTVTRVDPKFDDRFDIYVDDFGQSKKIAKDPLPGSAGVQLVSRAGEGSKKPEKPTATRKPKAPETPATDTSPKETPGKPKPARGKKSEQANLSNRKDDGKDITPATRTAEELREKTINNLIDEDGRLITVLGDNNKPRNIEDPNAIVDALLEENPNAKIKEDGTVVMERGKFTDTDGTEYGYEVGIQRTIGNQFMERYTISDPETSEVLHDYYNYDYKDSFAALYGKANGLVKTRDFLLGQDLPGGKGLDSDGIPVQKELRSYFGPEKTLDNRLKYLTKKYGAGRQQRLITPEDNNKRFLDGHGRLINQVDGTVARGFVDDIYEAIDSAEFDIIQDKFVQAMGRMPDTQEAKDALVLEFAKGLRERYAGKPEYAQLKHLPKRLNSALVMQDLDIRDIDRIPFVSQDGVSVVVPGTLVEFFNNEGASGVGRVVRLIPGSGKNGGYKDTAVVQFKDKTINNLQTRNMSILDATETDASLTPYVPKLVGEELRLKRIESGELRVDYNEKFFRKADDPDYSPEADSQNGDAGAPYLGESGVEGDSPSGESSTGFAAEDLLSGDPLYGKDGEFLGTVIDVEPVPAADGGEPGYAVTYLTPNGDENVEVLDKGELRSPK